MTKINQEFIKEQYRSGVENYSDFAKDVGLWASEKYVFQKYLQPEHHILDLGCGTGRTTFGLYQLGYQYILGLDLTPEMITEAKQLNAHFGTSINFRVGDATNLYLEDAQFDALLFSFNGIMSIPQAANRNKALREIHRVLKEAGTFIFTTHDRDRGEKYRAFWQEEAQRWQAEQQNPNLYEFGDLITTSNNETGKIFIHIPSQQEVQHWLQQHGFDILETFYRPDQFQESAAVQKKSGDCRFWVGRKLG